MPAMAVIGLGSVGPAVLVICTVQRHRQTSKGFGRY